MRCCWNEEAAARPAFRILTTKLEAMLADGVEYLDLTPKIVHNRTYFSGLPDAITPGIFSLYFFINYSLITLTIL